MVWGFVFALLVLGAGAPGCDLGDLGWGFYLAVEKFGTAFVVFAGVKVYVVVYEDTGISVFWVSDVDETRFVFE